MSTLIIPPEESIDPWEVFKIWRREQLGMSDWIFNSDCTIDQGAKDAIVAYRAFLKNAPNTYGAVEEIVFPGYMGVVDQNVVFIEENWSVGR